MDNTTTQKINDTTIEITTVEPAKENKNKYERSFIEQNIKDIQKKKDDFDALQDIKLAENNQILSEMDKLDIVVAVEPIPLPVEPTPINPLPIDPIIINK